MSTSSDRIIGTLRRTDDGRGAVRVEDVYDTDVDDLWSAVTDPARLARWLAEVEGDLQVGGTFRATFTSSWRGPGRVEVCEPPHRLLVTLEPGTEDETQIEAVLTADGDRTRLVVEERGIPVPGLAAHGAGWQAHLEDLARFLHGGQPSEWRARWTELTPVYRPLVVGL